MRMDTHVETSKGGGYESLRKLTSQSDSDIMKFYHRSESNSSDEGVVVDCPAQVQNVVFRTRSVGVDMVDCDTSRRRRASILEVSEDTSSSDDEIDMKRLDNRLDSFINWPVTHKSPQVMAGAGFFYLGVRDAVECAFCHNQLNDWSVGDIPLEEHKKFFPYCSYVISKSLDLTAAAPSTRMNIMAPAGSDDDEMAGEDVCGRYFAARNPRPVLLPSAPKVATMAMYNARFATFANWPVEKTQSPRDLATAGLFFTGQGDQTQCFHCGGFLQNWDRQDVPWTEHARWYPHCQYLIASMGQTFVEANNSGGSSSPSSGIEDASFSYSSSSQSSQESGTSSQGFSDEAMSDEETEEEIIGQAIMRKCDHNLIEQALREKRETFSFARFHSVDELMEAAKAIEVRQAEQKKTMAENMQKAKEAVAERSPADVESIAKEYERLKTERICKVCLDADSQMVFQPCGHLVCCVSCSSKMTSCPVCRTTISSRSRIYLS
ncbi:hypothetical protein RvY_14716-2 [Ramazzottius varieornatus]|uniref:RING-type domain-containing protein n=1 Tax=Ramazzottius varieornatus TaxID=947166 RepID=A0A1D1VS98_RAMVA|nr:hypothetical protein RvY_14716-2 [Ramazzottius varieornatus]